MPDTQPEGPLFLLLQNLQSFVRMRIASEAEFDSRCMRRKSDSEMQS